MRIRNDSFKRYPRRPYRDGNFEALITAGQNLRRYCPILDRFNDVVAKNPSFKFPTFRRL